MDFALSIVAGLVGVTAGAAFTWLISVRQAQVSVTFELHREYQSEAMAKSREYANRIVHKHPNATYVELWRITDPADMQYIFNIMYFFQRLWLGIRYRTVYRKVVPDLFGESFCYWYTNSFSKQLLPVGDEAAQHIQALHEWITDHSTEEQKTRWMRYLVAWSRDDSGS
jgi:hypothetical protein